VAGAERLRPDVVLMDIGLDGPGDGAEAAQIIRERFDIPSLFISAGSDREKRQRAMASRPLAYLSKPLAAAELKAALALLARPSPPLARVQPQGAQHEALFAALTPAPGAANTSPARPEAENGGPASTDGEPVP
jgi:DNA-binding NarL/FixJ family response regulator